MTKYFHSIAAWLAFIAPLFLVLGAYASQYIFGLAPCEMCHWQRWPHWAAIPIAILALALRNMLVPLSRVLVMVAALAIAISGTIGGWHAGIEYSWFEGVTQCTADQAAISMEQLNNMQIAPLVRCDQAPWQLFGISLAGYNFLISIFAVIIIWLLLHFSRHHAAPGAKLRAQAEAESKAKEEAEAQAAEAQTKTKAEQIDQDQAMVAGQQNGQETG